MHFPASLWNTQVSNQHSGKCIMGQPEIHLNSLEMHCLLKSIYQKESHSRLENHCGNFPRYLMWSVRLLRLVGFLFFGFFCMLETMQLSSILTWLAKKPDNKRIMAGWEEKINKSKFPSEYRTWNQITNKMEQAKWRSSCILFIKYYRIDGL